MQLVSLAIREALEKTRRNFSWLDQAHWQFGFPKMVNGIGIPAFERHLDEMIEREYRRFPADLKAWRKRGGSMNSRWRIGPRATKP